MELLSCKNLSIGYDNKVLMKDINIEVQEGDYVCILGQNGSGKSTFLKTLLGFVKPISGCITFSEKIKKSEIGYLSQQTQIQKDFPATVMEIVLSGFSGKVGLRPFYNAKEKAIALKNIEKMGLKGMEKKSFQILSGGQQQKVLLARALCATSKLLILDEPITGLDPETTKDLYDLIKKLNKIETITIIMVSHDIHSCLNDCSHVLNFGENAEMISIENYKKRGGLAS